MFTRYLTDVVTLQKADGQLIENVKAMVQPNLIVVADVSLSIEPNDSIIRELPSGVKEKFIVKEPGYQAGMGGIKAHYQIKCVREGQAVKKAEAQTINYNVSGPNARININSTDSSTNIANSDKIFSELKNLITAGIRDVEERQRLLAKTAELEAATGTKGFISKYQEFMVQAANHMTVLTPILPALAGLLPS